MIPNVPITAWRGNYVSLPTPMLEPPPEGNRTVPVAISWLQDAIAPAWAVHFNAREQRETPISQIAGIHVDNSFNSQACIVEFPDTQFQILVGPRSEAYYPVTTNGLEFFTWLETAPTQYDQTVIQVLNFLPPPVALIQAQAIAGGSGTVTQVGTGTGLTGGPINTTGTV